MKTTKTVNPDYKGLRERAGLTLETLAAKINYSVAAVNGLENNDQGGKRLRQIVLDTLTQPPAREGGGKTGGAAARGEIALAQERARAAEEKLGEVYKLVAELFRLIGGDNHPGGSGSKHPSPADDAASGRPAARARRTPLRWPRRPIWAWRPRSISSWAR